MQLQQAIRGDKLSDHKVLEIIRRRTKDKEVLIRKLLSNGDIKKARVECEKLLEQNAEAYSMHLLLAIAILIGEGPGPYTTSLIKLIEKHLESACKDESIKATAFVILGIIKHDHYFLNGLPQGNPSLDVIRRTIKKWLSCN